MSELLSENPWSEEACRDWLDQELERTGSDIIYTSAMPTAVLAFVKGLVKEQYFEPETDDRLTTWAKATLIAQTGIIDVDLGDTNR